MITITESEVYGSTSDYEGNDIYVYNNVQPPSTIDDHCEEE